MSSENLLHDYTTVGNDTNQNDFVDIHFIEVMEEILRFIYKQFYQQLNPDSRRFASSKISIPLEIDFECAYQIEYTRGYT